MNSNSLTKIIFIIIFNYFNIHSLSADDTDLKLYMGIGTFHSEYSKLISRDQSFQNNKMISKYEHWYTRSKVTGIQILYKNNNFFIDFNSYYNAPGDAPFDFSYLSRNINSNYELGYSEYRVQNFVRYYSDSVVGFRHSSNNNLTWMFGYGLNYESDQSNNSEYSLYGVSTSSFSGNGTLKTSMLNNIFYIRSNISQNDFLNLFFVYKFYIPIHGEFKFNSVLFSRPNLTFPSTIQMSSDSVYGNIHKITHKFEIGNNFILDNDS